MVAAFKCPSYNFEAREIYNQFVRTHRQTLANHNDVLKRHFMRAHGPIEGQRAYDRFTTTLANRDSDDSNATYSDYCEIAGMIGREGIETAPENLVELAADLRSEPAGTRDRCDTGAPITVAALVAQPVIAPQPAVAVQPAVNDSVPAFEVADAEAVVAAATPQPVVAVLTTADEPKTAPVLAQAEAPAPLLRKAAVTDLADPNKDAQADTARALAAAAVALQQAAEALKAAANPIPDAAPVARASVPGSKLN